MHPPISFRGERDLVRRKIHLALDSGSCFEPPHRCFRRPRPQRAKPFPHDGVAPLKTQPAQFLVQPHRAQIRVALQQSRNLIGIGIEQTRPESTLLFRGAGPAVLVVPEYAVYALAVDAQQARDASLRCPGVMQTHDLIASGFIHAVFSSFTRSRLSAATDLASRDSLSKRGARMRRSSAVSPARPWCASHTSMRPSTSSRSPTRFQT